MKHLVILGFLATIIVGCNASPTRPPMRDDVKYTYSSSTSSLEILSECQYVAKATQYMDRAHDIFRTIVDKANLDQSFSSEVSDLRALARDWDNVTGPTSLNTLKQSMSTMLHDYSEYVEYVARTGQPVSNPDHYIEVTQNAADVIISAGRLNNCNK